MEEKIFGKVLDITNSLLGTLNNRITPLLGVIKIKNIFSGNTLSKTVPIIGTLKKIDMPERFISVTPQHLFLTPSNFFIGDVDVLSNTIWDVK